MYDWFHSIWGTGKNLLESLSYLVTTGGIVALYVTFKSYSSQKAKESNESHEHKILYSLEVLREFSDEVIPGINEMGQNWQNVFLDSKEKILNNLNKKLSDNGRDTIESLPTEIVEKIQVNSKIDSGALDIFNKLEHLSVYMNYGLVDQELVFPTISKVFIGFISDNNDVLAVIKSEDAPFDNLSKLYDNLLKRKAKLSIDKRRDALDAEEKELEN